jgi:hypothetical protein
LRGWYTWVEMAILRVTDYDIRTQQLRSALRRIARCDLGRNGPKRRKSAHEVLREVEGCAASAGYDVADLYEYVIGEEEGRADLASEKFWKRMR